MARTVTEKCIVDAAASTARTVHSATKLPTGYGKSLCFASLPMLFDQVLPLKEPSTVIVISPLTAKLRSTYVYTYLLRTNVAVTGT